MQCDMVYRISFMTHYFAKICEKLVTDFFNGLLSR